MWRSVALAVGVLVLIGLGTAINALTIDRPSIALIFLAFALPWPFSLLGLLIPAGLFVLLVAKCPLVGRTYGWALLVAALGVVSSASYLLSAARSPERNTSVAVLAGIAGALAVAAWIARGRSAKSLSIA